MLAEEQIRYVKNAHVCVILMLLSFSSSAVWVIFVWPTLFFFVSAAYNLMMAAKK
jgi:hypothetical protein